MVVRRTSRRSSENIFPPGGMRASPGGYHFKRFPSEENREENQLKGGNKVECKGGVQKVECKRHIQKGKCREAFYNAPKHARWPAATCGFKAQARIPPGLRKDLPKGGVVLSFPRSSIRCFVVSSFRRSCCRGVVVSPMGCTTSRPEIC